MSVTCSLKLCFTRSSFFEYWRDGRDRPNKESELAGRASREKPLGSVYLHYDDAFVPVIKCPFF